jgi:hypothetical protein
MSANFNHPDINQMDRLNELRHYSHRGARALVLLHEQNLRLFYQIWCEAKRRDVTLPETDDTAYISLDTLMGHVLAAARGYMVWICKQLGLPDPAIDRIPEDDEMDAKAEAYLEHLLTQWRLPLADVPESEFEPQTYASNWGTHYCIDAMLEHAVMHPIRHEFQLRELMAQQN